MLYVHSVYWNAWTFDRIEPEETEDRKEGGPRTIDVGKEAAIEAEVQAARQRAVVPLEIRMKQFRDMLAEKEVIDIEMFLFDLLGRKYIDFWKLCFS